MSHAMHGAHGSNLQFLANSALMVGQLIPRRRHHVVVGLICLHLIACGFNMIGGMVRCGTIWYSMNTWLYIYIY